MNYKQFRSLMLGVVSSCGFGIIAVAHVIGLEGVLARGSNSALSLPSELWVHIEDIVVSFAAIGVTVWFTAKLVKMHSN
jgi:hypothetical protein